MTTLEINWQHIKHFHLSKDAMSGIGIDVCFFLFLITSVINCFIIIVNKQIGTLYKAQYIMKARKL